MSYRRNLLLSVAIAAAFAIPMVSTAQAKSCTNKSCAHRASYHGLYNTTAPVGAPVDPAIYSSPTFPEGSPNYHGGNGA